MANPYDRTCPSLYRGIVEDNVDPNNLGRCKIRVPSVHGELTYPIDILPWARPLVLSPVSKGRGSVNIPDIGDIVWVLFEGANRDFPIYLGGAYGVSDLDIDTDEVLLYTENNNTLSYNRPSSTYTIKSGGNMISISPAGITISGNVTINGDISSSGSMNSGSDATVSGSMKVGGNTSIGGSASVGGRVSAPAGVSTAGSSDQAYQDYDVPDEALADDKFANMLAKAEQYLGTPYKFGGRNPEEGSVDCSGFVSWVINNCGNGWNLGDRTAEGLRQATTPVSAEYAAPGDLIFFEKTYDTTGASHVGIYVGNGMMIHAGNPVSYESIESNYWQSHFLGYGRID